MKSAIIAAIQEGDQFAITVMMVMAFLAGLCLLMATVLMRIAVWGVYRIMQRMEDRTIAMRRMMRLMEEHLRVLRTVQTGEQLEPRDPEL